MQTLLKPISYLALIATILPALLYMGGVMPLNAVQLTALIGTVAWFVATPLWMGRNIKVDADQVKI
ncbi:hypothetical protein [Aeoliella mucimassa]|uniref:Uncharacterized protein n=1 Tax=Aeoliella mucimassa TaxID=2527972 RepID=A0A518AJ98_9BACT|nr:hypothetical protein [Aeoliella mucimassa]QDU54807.1 hypothetical protein Pan181_09900 [Aeoliella mucimassa]